MQKQGGWYCKKAKKIKKAKISTFKFKFAVRIADCNKAKGENGSPKSFLQSQH